MSDLIERQAVIQVIDAVFPVDPMKSEYAQGIACGAALAKTYVKQLPSAQPDRELIEQLRWEKDTAIQQLKDLGYGLGEKPRTDDTISRQAAIDVLHGYFDGMLETDTICPKDLYNLFEVLPSAQPEQRWIPCSVKLPEQNQICIVTDETRRGTYEYGFHDETYDEVNGWTFMGHKIIAWMPLPEPYKEEQE